MEATPSRHHPIVRVTHWVNAIALLIMIGSGLRIFNSYPAFARKGETFCCYPFEGHRFQSGSPLVVGWPGARQWHFTAMWLLVVNGLVYLSFIYLHGEWRDLVPRRGVVRDVGQMLKFYLALRKDHPRQGKHNALQRLAYFSMPVVGAIAVGSGTGDMEAGAARAVDVAARRIRVGALLAFSCDADAGRAHGRPRVHGVRRRSVFAAGNGHRRVR